MRSSNWAEVNCVRWREGQLSPIGGQSQYNYAFASRCRAVHGWYDLNKIYRIAYLCEQHLYVDTGGVLVDITPLSAVGATPVGYGDANYGDAGYSGDPTYGLTPPAPFDPHGGYSDGNYGDATYGDTRASSGLLPIDELPDAFSLENFGAVLYAMTSPDERLLMWDPAVGGRAVVQPAASGRGPVPNGRCFVVTPERFILVFGAHDATNGGGFRRFAWCDQENPGAWDYSNVTSQAGFLDIEPASPIITAISTRTGTLFWTAKKAYVSQFLGIPYVFNYVELAANCTPWSPQSMATTSSIALWMSEQGLFSYDGTSIQAQACKVRPWVDDDIDIVNVRQQACAVHVENFNEFWWFFPQDGQPYNTRAVIYSYKEGWWSQARMSRSAGITSSYTSYTIMADGLVAYQHELGLQYGGADPPFAETFDLNLNSGGALTTVKQLIPDVEGDISNLLYSVLYRMSRSLGAPELQSPRAPIRHDGYVDLRSTGRDVRLRLDVGSGIVRPFTLGQCLIDAVPRGDR
jgi:hypothetical protein